MGREGYIFFCEDDENKSFNHARRWAKHRKKTECPSVIKAKINIDSTLIFDLTETDHRKLFHESRNAYFNEAEKRADKHNISLDKTYKDKLKLDCMTINRLCDQFDFKAVLKPDYIYFLEFENLPASRTFPNSTVPNCTLFCLRDESFIVCLHKIC